MARLRIENRQMHRFLADYGMEWVGDEQARNGTTEAGPGNTGAGNTGTSMSSAAAAPVLAVPTQTSQAVLTTKPAGSVPDMERVRIAVSELNDLASNVGSSDVVKRPDGSHGFSGAHSVLQLTVWRDGLQASGLTLLVHARARCVCARGGTWCA